MPNLNVMCIECHTKYQLPASIQNRVGKISCDKCFATIYEVKLLFDSAKSLIEDMDVDLKEKLNPNND